MRVTPLLASSLLCAASCSARSVHQNQLVLDTIDFDLIYEQAPSPTNSNKLSTDSVRRLKKAEIIPTVIDTFDPYININLTWSNATAAYGNTVSPAKTQDKPVLTLVGIMPYEDWSAIDRVPQLTVALTDPDAPSRENPEWSEICHWLVTIYPPHYAAEISGEVRIDGNVAEEIMEYKPPGPPPKTGKHRYVAVALAPVNGTTERLDLVKPEDRQHWGYENERQGLRKWAGEMELKVVGANFIYEQNDEQ